MKQVTLLICLLALGLLAVPSTSLATFDWEFTFSQGSTPWEAYPDWDSQSPWPDPNHTGQVYIDMGIWDPGAGYITQTPGYFGGWDDEYPAKWNFLFSYAAGDPQYSADGPLIHGETIMRGYSGQWSPNYDDCTLIAYSDNESPNDSNRFMWKAGEGTLHLWLTNGAWQTVVEVDNDDNDWHTYGWQLDIITHELKLYFDGNQLGTWDAGDAVAYGLIDFGDEIDWNGDYIHRNDFTYFSMKEGPIPEPATVVLLALGGVVLLSRRRQEALFGPGS